MELISVIVPVYNVEAYLDRCIQSIVNQTYTNLEIILVDDGSPDACPQMCDAWAKRDSRIQVIHQKNSGAGAARNAGMSIAKGNFLAFVDSDDVLHPDMYSHLMSHMEPDTDIVECDFFLTDSNVPCFSMLEGTESVSVYSTTDALSLHIADTCFRQIIWNKIYRRHTVASVSFPIGKLIDDEFWTYQVLGNAKKLKHSTARLYAYMQQPDSVMHIAYSLRRLQAVEAKECRLDYLCNHFPSLASHAAANLWSTCVYHGQLSLRYLDKLSQKTAFSILKKVTGKISNRFDLKHNLTSIYRIWFLLSKFSFKGVCKSRNFLKVGL